MLSLPHFLCDGVKQNYQTNADLQIISGVTARAFRGQRKQQHLHPERTGMNPKFLIFHLLLVGAVAWRCSAENNGVWDSDKVKSKLAAGGNGRGPRGDTLPIHLDSDEREKRKISQAKGDLDPIGGVHEQDTPINDSPARSAAKAPAAPKSTPAPYSQHHVFLEHQNVAFKCPPEEFISRLHVSYGAGLSHSTSFTYSFQFRRQSIVLAHYGSSSVNQFSCHGLKHCVGHRACIFQVTSNLCLHDPQPGHRKVNLTQEHATNG